MSAYIRCTEKSHIAREEWLKKWVMYHEKQRQKNAAKITELEEQVKSLKEECKQAMFSSDVTQRF